MATLKQKHKEFIIIQLACFKTATQVKNIFEDIFGIEISTSQISYYKPTGAQGADQLADKWKKMFTHAREKYLEETEEVPIANERYRLEIIQEGVEELVKAKNYLGAAKLAEQAAKEVGGAFTNKHELTGKDGGPIETSSKVQIYLPDNGRGNSSTGE